MKTLLMIFSLIFTFSAHANFIQDVKDRFQGVTYVGYEDWYNKGDTAFAEYDGLSYGVYQKLKVAVRENEINIKMQFINGTVRPDADHFARVTSELCVAIFQPFVSTVDTTKKSSSWDDATAPVIDAPLSFMFTEKNNDTNSNSINKKINGWDVSIKRSALLTSCTARKLN
ncbi:MAG: hypothetical protein RR818_01380 [Citrobacter sp.]